MGIWYIGVGGDTGRGCNAIVFAPLPTRETVTRDLDIESYSLDLVPVAVSSFSSSFSSAASKIRSPSSSSSSSSSEIDIMMGEVAPSAADIMPSEVVAT